MRGPYKLRAHRLDLRHFRRLSEASFAPRREQDLKPVCEGSSWLTTSFITSCGLRIKFTWISSQPLVLEVLSIKC